MNRLIFPMKKLRITQTYYGTVSHKPHTNGNKVDFPIDIAGADGGRDGVYCPCDEMEINRIYGVSSKGVNTIWLTSTSPVQFANGNIDYVTLMFIHPNDDDLRKLRVGQKFKRKEYMFREGTDGATGNHVHMAVGVGEFVGNGWMRNSNGKWVLLTSKGAIRPESAMYIDDKFTTVLDSKGLLFKKLPKNDNPYREPNYICNRRHHEYGKIRKGDEGVKWIHYELKQLGFYTGNIDGFFGPQTEQAVKKFQTYATNKGVYHDQIDGSVGPLTRNAIKAVR